MTDRKTLGWGPMFHPSVFMETWLMATGAYIRYLEGQIDNTSEIPSVREQLVKLKAIHADFQQFRRVP